ncbi:unnamed protein product [Camellia sinensis]
MASAVRDNVVDPVPRYLEALGCMYQRISMIDSHKRIAIDNGIDDIVSGLPRNLIDNILERMPVRDAARTSMLSRNWRRLFKQLSRNGNKELNLDNRNVKSYKLPSYVLSCPKLTHLKLRNCICKLPEAFVGLCNLISLPFEKMAFAANIFETLVPSPVPWVLSIPFNQLKHLVFTKLRFDDVDQMSCVLCLLRSSPNMKKHRITASAVRDNAVESAPRYLVARGCMYQLLNQL